MLRAGHTSRHGLKWNEAWIRNRVCSLFRWSTTPESFSANSSMAQTEVEYQLFHAEARFAGFGRDIIVFDARDVGS